MHSMLCMEMHTNRNSIYSAVLTVAPESLLSFIPCICIEFLWKQHMLMSCEWPCVAAVEWKGVTMHRNFIRFR